MDLNIRVLVVDDFATMRRIIKGVLKQLGFSNIVEAEDGDVALEELKKDEYGSGWFRCDQAEGVLKESIDYLGGWLDDQNISWFPRLDEIKSEEFYVYPWSIYFHGIRPTAVELVFLRPKDKMLYYISTKE